MAAYPGGEAITVSATGVLGLAERSTGSAFTGYASCQVVGAMTGTILCEGSFDSGTTWVALAVTDLTANTVAAGGTGITAAGIYRVDVGGIPRFRWRCSALSAGTPAFYPRIITG